MRILSLLLLVGLGCASGPTVQVVNTSGYAVQVLVFHGEDIYLVDTVQTGKDLCWKVPDFASGQKVIVALGPEMSAFAASGTQVRFWNDSLVLDGRWTMHVHAPRQRQRTDRASTPTETAAPNPFLKIFDKNQEADSGTTKASGLETHVVVSKGDRC
jgi:hypothetical protein